MNYFSRYKTLVNEAMETIDEASFNKMLEELTWTHSIGIPLLVGGNGGSAAIAEHLSCDHTKGVAMDTHHRPIVIPLQSNVSLITAIANDIGYEEIFSKQIEWFSRSNVCAVMMISSSGNSPNIVKGLTLAKTRGIRTLAMVGFDGGAVVKNNLADIILHVKSNNYGVVEDCHQILMHALAQSIRITNANKPDIKL